ncbi:MAG: tRNA (N6-isopentenyl adenosine(37)-C2)-methylthiotransferase MiaB [Clostridiales bacterium]|nr:tRNA (N6-isopentenyl adenosine(37)-C2)-methylthiotransferase MiaB [Clostridiales bacterium]
MTRPAPEKEPERQYHFMDLLKEALEQEQTESGKTRTYSITTMGCQMNARDSEKLRGILEYIGYREAAREKDADLVIYNTCCVRENAEQKVYGKLGYLKGFKKQNPNLKICLCGCMMQEDAVLEKIQKSYPQVDLIFGTHNIYKFAELLATMEESGSRIIDIWQAHGEIVEDLPSLRKFGFKASVNIMFGCDNFCTYCIVPYVRGRERSRKPEEILKEIRDLAADGVKEIQLLGQNVNSYGRGLEEPITFAELLYKIAEIEGIERIRFMTSHPKDLSDDLIQAMRDIPQLMPHFHLPLQSGSSELLHRMNRHYDKARYLERAEALQAAVPGISLTTDIIVGFPGETEEDFEETLDVVRKVGFDSAFTFIYSPRIGTPAAVMEQAPEEVTKPRFDRLLKVLEEVIEENNQKRLHQTYHVLAESVSKNGMLTGRTETNQLVHFEAPECMIGQIVPVTLDESKIYYFIGHLERTCIIA